MTTLKMTKPQFEAMFKEHMMPGIRKREGGTGIDDPMRSEAWLNTIDGYVKDGILRESAYKWTYPTWLERP
jgi:hypothetical protein